LYYRVYSCWESVVIEEIKKISESRYNELAGGNQDLYVTNYNKSMK